MANTDVLPNAIPGFISTDSSIDPEATVLEKKESISPWSKPNFFKIPVRIEHSSAILLELTSNADMTLYDLNDLLFKEFPMLDSRPFVYLYRGTPLHQAHWPIYGARAFKNGLELRIVSSAMKSRASVASSLTASAVEGILRNLKTN
eukprot:TRINITY_DN7125_c0_g1_i2.p1 TRINITY_DN7125_c0_g1~~TRINITY_DN7125_c0_g1_i2.p1  ORF type:complete len:147 (-),score=35.18 TRINITY_DN7125_c0_g1_i2:158-598(-)